MPRLWYASSAGGSVKVRNGCGRSTECTAAAAAGSASPMKAPWNTSSGMATVLSSDDPASELNSSW